MTYRVDSIRDLPAALIKRNPKLREMAGEPAPKPTKYHNKKTSADGITFDSKLECNRYHELKLLKQAGVITGFELQPRFLLQDAYIDGISRKFVKKMEYVADFRVFYPDGHEEIEDTKSKATMTKVYRIKKKLFRKLFPALIFNEIK